MHRETTRKILPRALCALALCGGAAAAVFSWRALRAARAPAAPSAPAVRIAWPSMGTEAALLFRSGPQHGRAAALDCAKNIFARFESALSAWRPDSGLARINALAGTGAGETPPPEFLPVYAAAAALAAETDGAFNPLVGSAMRLYGFNGADRSAELTSPEALRAVPFSWRGFSVSPSGEVAVSSPGARLDLGAIAKGAAVDCAFNALSGDWRTRGLVVDLGGNLRAIGESAPGSGGWPVEVKNPFDKTRPAARILLRHGEAVATSGNYERFRIAGGKRVSHILDGRTALPASGIAGCTVVAPTAMEADGLSTALFVLGPEEGMEFLRRTGRANIAALWIPDNPSNLQIIANPAMSARFSTQPR